MSLLPAGRGVLQSLASNGLMYRMFFYSERHPEVDLSFRSIRKTIKLSCSNLYHPIFCNVPMTILIFFPIKIIPIVHIVVNPSNESNRNKALFFLDFSGFILHIEQSNLTGTRIMGDINTPQKVFLIAAIVAKDVKLLHSLLPEITAEFGPVMDSSESFSFDHTNYYEKETENSMRRLVDIINLLISVLITVLIIGLTIVSTEIGFVNPPSPLSR